ncbi:phage virion morphogenesis protein [Altericroceibacterium endophyticum]|uniref:Phage virion morphogenesis protein n=1 Tax=Altericroceibacterium endophyticum TaxID=1808508 RepID=A0A6I4T1N2_9SPHN|nr:phage virion morphogenesis protein [Altericroceibacterium endophyticum]MXO64846.1 phage virion morphogenesis protein [Altericroceibacterium endophyticum]
MEKGDSLEQIEPFLDTLFDAVELRSRRKLQDKLMRFARRANAQRIRQNVEPDRSRMAPRKKHRKRRGKMFRNIGKASNLRIRTAPDKGELYFSSGTAHTAAVHHFGQVGYVGKAGDGSIIRTKYEARRLLGFGKEQDELLDEVLRHLSGD